MKAYFASFNGFVRDPNASFAREFNRLATFRNWNPKSKSRKWQKERAKAVEAEFSAYYDTSVTSLESWQKLCDKTSVGPVPTSIVECKKALQSVLVNIFDLIDAYRTGDPVHVFNDWKALWAYTKAGKFYDLERAMSNELLKALLRDESEPPQGKQKKKQRKRT